MTDEAVRALALEILDGDVDCELCAYRSARRIFTLEAERDEARQAAAILTAGLPSLSLTGNDRDQWYEAYNKAREWAR